MPSKTYKIRAIVLRKTKLREKDLIVTMLDEGGTLLQGVAKGARKPGGSLAARLELFSLVDVLMARGRSLDVVCEARLANGGVREIGMEQGACAAPVAELLASIAQPELAQPRLFDLAGASFARIAHADSRTALSIAAASLWKVLAQSGFRPSFRRCVSCGADTRLSSRELPVALSIAGGGAFCESCPRPADALLADANVLAWVEALIGSTFDEVAALECDTGTLFSVLHLVRAWAREHTGRDLKSLDFLFTAGLF